MINRLSVFERLHFKYILLIILIKLDYFYKNSFVSSSVTSVSKCHYEGDFSVNCKEANELMRSANVINGLHYNDSQCVFNPRETHCYRQTVLAACVDKKACSIRNDWFSLQPECDGNSYYTQFNFDCQPAYHMCEDTVIKDAFSGLIYSPFYPNSFRTESSQPCFLTINLPKDHHVEITLDHFDIFKYQNCLADFLEIQEYKEDVSGIYNSKNLLNKRSISSNNTTNEQHKAKLKVVKKMSNSNRQRTYKWSTVALMCGKEDSKLVMKATSDIINFKFRSISSNHHYFNHINNTRVYTGFKIYFQAIPPSIENKNQYGPVQTNSKETNTNKNNINNSEKATQEKTSHKILKNDNKNKNNQNNENLDTQSTDTSKSTDDMEAKSSGSMLILTLIILIFTIAIIVVSALVIIFFKRRGLFNHQSFSNSSKKQAKNGLDTTKLKEQQQQQQQQQKKQQTGLTVSPKASNNKTSKTTPITNNKNNSNNKNVKSKSHLTDESDHSPKFSTTTRSDTATQPSPVNENNKPKFSAVSSKLVPHTNQVRTILEPEPRKMQAERPALLQDLDKSKILIKYKQSIVEPIARADQQHLAKLINDTSKTALSPEKSTCSLKLNSSIKTDELSGVYTGGVTESVKPSPVLNKPCENSIYGADLVNVKANEAMRKKSDEKAQQESPVPPASSSSSNESKIINKNKHEIQQASTELRTTNETTKIEKIPLVKEASIISIEAETEAAQTKLEIVEETSELKENLDYKESTKEDHLSSSLETSSLIQPSTSQQLEHHTPRRSTFNPLHVILKDKNKYYTTEYI